MADISKNPDTDAAAKPPALAAPESATGAAKTAENSAAQAKKSLPVLALVATTLALIALGGGYWLFQQLQTVTARLDQLASHSHAQQQQLDNLGQHPALTHLQNEHQQALDRLQAELEKVADRLTDIAAAAERAREIATRNETEWSLAEVEYLLRLGSWRAQLLHDIEGAVAAFSAADQALHRLADPALIPVRKAIQDNIAALRLAERPDIPGIAIRLSGLIQQVALLPRPRLIPATAAAETDKTGSFWDFLDRFIIVRRETSATVRSAPAAAIDDQREALLYALNTARNAALRSDSEAYRQALRNTADSLNQHFNQQDAVVEQFRMALNTLLAEPLRLNLPSVDQPLQSLQSFMARSDLPKIETAPE